MASPHLPAAGRNAAKAPLATTRSNTLPFAARRRLGSRCPRVEITGTYPAGGARSGATFGIAGLEPVAQSNRDRLVSSLPGPSSRPCPYV